MQNPNIIIIVIDAGRPDYFGCYGFPLNTTPNIDKIANQGVLFEDVISTAPWTLPSHGSLFTGLYPYQHKATWQTLKLKEGVPTIFDIFIDKGYDAAAISANGLILSPYNMFGKRVKILNRIPENKPNISSFRADFDYRQTSCEKIADGLLRYLDESKDKPFIAYVNFYDLHAKYKAREPFDSQFVNKENDAVLKEVGDYYSLHFREMNDETEITPGMISALRALYSAKLAMIDSEIARIFKKLEEKHLLENSIIVITSDHGDILGDHKKPSFHHQFSIYNSLLKVPLIFYGVGKYKALSQPLKLAESFGQGPVSCWKGINLPKRINVPCVQNIDIFPTILDFCGIEKADYLVQSPAISLVQYIKSDRFLHKKRSDLPIKPRQYAISMYEGPSRFILRNQKKVNPLYLRSLMAIQDEEYKLIFSDKGEYELYHIKTDKNEQKNIADMHPEIVSRLKNTFYEIKGKYREPGDEGGEPVYAAAEEEKIVARLKALGYIE